jgi:ubiquinone biosynthesis protein
VVVLKVQRPGIRAIIETDLRILKAIADQAERTNSSLELFNFPAMVTDFARQILSELDFVKDGKNADLFRKNMAGFEKVKIPKIFWQYSGERLLVMEYMRGVRIDKTAQIVKMGVDPEAVAKLGLHVYMKQIFDDGFFHGDPHPGNILVTRNGEIILLDFGLIGVLRPEKRNLLMKMLMTILDKDVDGLTDVLTDLGIRVKDSWMDAFKDDLYLALISGEGYNEEQPDAGAVEGLISALRKYRLKVPMVTMLMLKVISMVQDDATMLYPRFDFLAEIKPLIVESFTKRVLNQANIRKTGLDFAEAFLEAKDIPSNVNLALKKISQGSFTWRIAHDDLDRLGGSIDMASYKIMLGMIIASIVVGTSLVVLATREVLTFESFQVTVAIYLAAILVGIFVVLQLIRERRKH